MYKLRNSIRDGTNDYIFGECELKRKISEKLILLFKSWGYDEIMTPTLEYLDVFSGSCLDDIIRDEDIYKLTDEKNRLLSLRADCTMPIARVAASKLADTPIPYRLCYNQKVFNASSRFKENRQCGVELIGNNDIKADIEILSLAVMSLKEFFKSDFSIELGHGKLFKILVEEFDIDEKTAQKAKMYIEKKNFAAIQAMKIPNEIKLLPKMFGDSSVLDEFLQKSSTKRITEILDYLKQLYSLLKENGFGQNIVFDLGIVHSLDYYNGIIFRGFVPDSGQTILSGGRYDNLLEKYGKELAAIGFGISNDCIYDIIKKSNINPNIPNCLIYYENNYTKESYELANSLISSGKRILFSSAKSKDEAKNEALKRNIKTIYYITKDDRGVETL